MENLTNQTNPQPSEMSWAELKEYIAATSVQMRESDRMFQEAKKEFQETRKLMHENFEREREEREKRVLEREKEYQKRQEEYQRRQEEYQRRQEEYEREKAEREKAYQKRKEEYEQEKAEREKAYQKRKEEYEQEKAEREKAYQKRKEEYEQEKAEREAMKKIADEERKETNRKIRELTTRFTSQTGHIVEGLMESSAMKIFKQSGFDIDKCWKEMKGKNKAINRQMEVDLFYHDTTESIAVEVKTKCGKVDIDHFIEQMGYFKQIFPEFSKSTVYVAIAAIDYERESDKYAAERGLFVIRVNDDTFTLDPAQKETRLSF